MVAGAAVAGKVAGVVEAVEARAGGEGGRGEVRAGKVVRVEAGKVRWGAKEAGWAAEKVAGLSVDTARVRGVAAVTAAAVRQGGQRMA